MVITVFSLLTNIVLLLVFNSLISRKHHKVQPFSASYLLKHSIWFEISTRIFQAEQIDTREYSRWRHLGLAFELRQANYNRVNRTLASGRPFKTRTGETNVFWGYWGDIVCSPFICFGIDTEHCHELERKINGKFRYGAATTSEVNVRRMLWQLETHRPCPIRVAAPFLDTNGPDDDDDEKDSTTSDVKTDEASEETNSPANGEDEAQEVTGSKWNWFRHICSGLQVFTRSSST